MSTPFKIEIPYKAKNCLDCPHHEVIMDPDPHDSFCSDDEAVVCNLVKNNRQEMSSLYRSDRHVQKAVSKSCRPYNTRKESETPSWCPLTKVS